MRFLLFAGRNYYPAGGARDCVGAYEYSHEPAAMEWAEQFDPETDERFEDATWKHLARIDAAGVTIVRAWTRDYEFVENRQRLGPWEVREVPDA